MARRAVIVIPTYNEYHNIRPLIEFLAWGFLPTCFSLMTLRRMDPARSSMRFAVHCRAAGCCIDQRNSGLGRRIAKPTGSYCERTIPTFSRWMRTSLTDLKTLDA